MKMAANAETVVPDAVEFEEVETNYEEVEVATSDVFLFDPLKYHNYTLLRPEGTKPTLSRRPTKRIFKKKPKITSLTVLFNCVICGYATTKKDVFAKHREVHKEIAPGVRYKPCDNCNINKDAPKGYQKCPHCSYYAKNVASLRVHMHSHSNKTGYKCTECNFYGKDIKDLVNHLKTTKKFSCEFCNFSSHVREKIMRHSKKHEGKGKS